MEGLCTMSDKGNFKNPAGYWEHQGAYTVELTDDAPTDHLPDQAVVEGRIVRVAVGRIKQVMGGIQFYCHEQPFSWGYKKIKTIKGSNGELIWINNQYR